ncbi:alpha-galactosidase [Deinococcus metalli]|uniref:Alpha-galactosidase n=1 Tax=Deinococcus metalli TaxID=1141878 RepID=A0A7W8KFM3_9DEIO|nr:glycoside hydrolase family 36 protein [Deinococcus metalli]MBB5377040.1 alpha-galactosidase [Deinococcus metalli]GHF49377.1 alpha-galactosidase [Deinococcus metalli]
MPEWTLAADPSTLRVLTSGYQSWSEAELRFVTDTQPRALLQWMTEQGQDPAFPPSDEAGVWRSHTLIALIRPDGGGWVGCALDATHTFTHWEARAGQGEVTLTCTLEGPDVEVAFEETADVIATVEALSAELGRRMNALTPPPLRVWCSWYSYYRSVTLEDMLHNARRARELDLPFDVFQLDDGFQADLGDWTEPSAWFGGHARDLPAALKALGFRAGLWLAPVLVGPHSKLYAAHPEYLLQNEDGSGPLLFGNNWGGPYAALDTTHPGALAWLRDLAATVRGWGYDYLKIDFLYAASQPGGRHDPGVGRAQAYRQALDAIREGFGDGFILGCGAPLATSIGVVDAMRTGPDVAPFWDDEGRRVHLRDGATPNARSALHTALSRWYQHTWYQPDPDVMIARRELSMLNEHERQAVAGMLDVIGGLRASSDPIDMLDAAGLALLRRSLELSTPDRPTTLARSNGGAVTHFTRGTFNLTDAAVDGLPPHTYQPTS